MLENIRNVITRLQMDRLGRNLGGRIPSCSQYWKCYKSSYDGTDWDETWVVASHQVSDMSDTMRLPWQWLLPGNGALNIQQLWASGGQTREPILMKFGLQQQIRTTMTVT